MRLHVVAALLVVSVPLFGSVRLPRIEPGQGQPAQPSPRELFERARMLEESNHGLPEAIALYAQVAAQAGDRQLAATAQLRIGLLNDRLGRKDDAQRAFRAVIDRHGDQPVLVRQAKERLEPPQAMAGSGPRARQVWAALNASPLSAPSPDGRLLSHVDFESGNLAVRDLAAGTSQLLTRDGTYTARDWQWAEFSVFSSDSRHLAYGWSRNSAYELKVVAADGSNMRTIYRSDSTSLVHPFAWTPDGLRILATLSDTDGSVRLALVTVATGAVRTLKTLDWRGPVRASLSPDGAWIAYDFPPREEWPARDVYLLAADGSREIKLVEHPSNDFSPMWTPDGEHVMFLTDRGGSMAAWIQRVTAGRAAGPARLLKSDMHRAYPLGFTARGALHYLIQSGQEDIYVAHLAENGNRMADRPSRASEHLVGANSSPDWSPDGSRLAYVSKRLPRPLNLLLGARVICVVDMASGQVRQLSPPLAYLQRPRWSPDGRDLLVAAAAKGQSGLYRLNVDSGEFARLVQLERPGYFNGSAWSRDGRTIFYIAAEGTGAGQRVMSLELSSGRERVLDDSPGPKSDLAVSHDGDRLAYRASAGTVGALRILGLEDGSRRDLVPGIPVGGFRGLNWTSDDQALIFATLDEKTRRIHLERIPAAGGAPRRFADGFDLEHLLDVRLHPDGRRFAFSSREGLDEIWSIENFLPHVQRTSVNGRR